SRPAEVGTRETFGHWECDLLIFRRETGKANVTSLVERKSRFTFLLANQDKRSAAVVAGIADVLRCLPEGARRTITFDRGSEFAGYTVLDRDLAVKAVGSIAKCASPTFPRDCTSEAPFGPELPPPRPR